MKNITSQFNHESSIALSDDPVLLNGMKIIFEKAVPTTPVSLVPKGQKTKK